MQSQPSAQLKGPDSSPPNSHRSAIMSTHVMLEDQFEPVEAIILIQDEKIVDTIILFEETKLSQIDSVSQHWEIIDYGNLFIFPGIIDTNVYLHADAGSEWENVTYSTELAATGGVTTIIDNPIIGKPFTSGEEYVESLQQRISIIRQNSKVDFGVYGVLDPNTVDHIDEMLDLGVLGLKLFMMSPFQNTVGHYPPESLKTLIEGLEEKHPGLLLLIHPEAATDRELYLSSPCRTCSVETRLDKHHVIQSLEFGGGANKGSFYDDFSNKNGSDEEDECPTARLDSPSKLISKIKKNKEKMQSRVIALSELATYSNTGSDIDSPWRKAMMRSQSYPGDPHNVSVEEEPDVEDDEQERKIEANLLSLRLKELSENNVVNFTPHKKSLFSCTDSSRSTEESKENNYNEKSRHRGSLDEGFLAGIPEELDKEESRGTLRQIISDSQAEPVSLRSYCEEELQRASKREIEESENGQTFNDIGEEPKLTPNKRVGRARYSVMEELEEYQESTQQREPSPPAKGCSLINLIPTSNINPFGSQSSLKEERSTFDSFDACFRSGQKEENSPDKEEPKNVKPEKHVNDNRKLLSLVTESDLKDAETRASLMSEHKSPLDVENNNEENSAYIPLPTSNGNLSPVRPVFDMEGSPQGFETESPNMSPVFSHRASSPVSSSLLLRRISRKSSCNIATNSTLPSPTSDFKKVNLLNISNTSKGPSAKEAEHNQNYKVFLANRPQSWEENAVTVILSAIKPETEIRVILQNLSLGSSFYKIRQKQKSAEGMAQKIISDTCPSYLCFSESMIKKGETQYKVSPPFRNKANREILVETLCLGGVDIMSSYHFFVPRRFKVIDDGNFRRAFGGLDSMGCTLQAAWTAALEFQQKNNKRFLEDFRYRKKITSEIFKWIYKAMCYNPAKTLKISKNKGSIAKGKDADLVIWDPYSVDNTTQLSPNHVFAGKQLYGKVHKTYLRGNLIYDKDGSDRVAKQYTPKFVSL